MSVFFLSFFFFFFPKQHRSGLISLVEPDIVN